MLCHQLRQLCLFVYLFIYLFRFFLFSFFFFLHFCDAAYHIVENIYIYIIIFTRDLPTSTRRNVKMCLVGCNYCGYSMEYGVWSMEYGVWSMGGMGWDGMG